MTTVSVFRLSDFLHTADGVVIGPAWSDDLSRELLRALRLTRPAAPDDSVSVAIAARVFHEVLSLHPSASLWPLFAGQSVRPSLFKSAVLQAFSFEEAESICRLDEPDLMLASNVARWMLRLPQQQVSTITFADPPSSPPSRFHRRLVERRALKHKDVAVA